MREVRLRLPRGIATGGWLQVHKRETRWRTQLFLLNRRAEDRGRGWPQRATNQRTAKGLPLSDASVGSEGQWNGRTTGAVNLSDVEKKLLTNMDSLPLRTTVTSGVRENIFIRSFGYPVENQTKKSVIVFSLSIITGSKSLTCTF